MFHRKKQQDDEWTIADLVEDEWDIETKRQRRKRWWPVIAIAMLLLLMAGSLLIGKGGARGEISAAISPENTRRNVEQHTPTVHISLTPTSPPPLTSPDTLIPQLASSPEPAFVYNPQVLQWQMLTLINQDRQDHSLNPVEWDESAAQVGAAHAADMLANGYFSHWNTQGWGPDHRYSFAGGQHAVMENLHTFSYTYPDGRGAPVEDWEAVMGQAQEGLMNSPGHRANILDPAHTHVGIGMAYDAVSGQFYLAQEFTNQYVTLVENLPLNAEPGSHLLLRGEINGENLSQLLFSLAYEPFPVLLSPQELAQRSTYVSAAQSIEVQALDMVFDEVVILGNQPGLYHVRLFVDIAGEQALVMDHVVWVGLP